MEFAFTEEQIMIRETAAAFLQEASTSAAVRAAMDTELGYDPELWSTISSDMFWQAIHLPENCGGMGLGYVELVATLEQMGRYLLCSPFFSTVCLAANALLVHASDEQQIEWLSPLASGEKTATLAYTSRGTDWSAESVSVTWTPVADGYELNGEYRYVIDGHSADCLILAAREVGSTGADGIRLFLVDSDTKGLQRQRLGTIDETRKQAAICCDSLRVPVSAVLGDPATEACSSLSTVIDLATICVAAEQVGCSQQALDSTIAYTRERVQFGRTIASYQAVKHKAADMMLKVEAARSAAYYAACIAEEALSGGVLGQELAEAASVAKAYCSDAAYFCTGTGIQLHGGVGFTWEYDIQMYFKRARASEALFGAAGQHRERLAAMLLDAPAIGGAL